MQRQPEPELMDDDEQAYAYAHADFEEPHENFISLFKECFHEQDISGDVLDLGCGPADVTIRFARFYPLCRITGVDGSDAMLAYGAKSVEKDGLSSRVQLIKVHLPKQQPPFQPYDAIISNSLLHHLENPMDLWQVVTNLGREKTCVFIMDLMRPESEQEARKLVDAYAANESEILQRDFYYSLLSAYTIEEVQEQLIKMGLNQFKIKSVSDRHMIIWSQL